MRLKKIIRFNILLLALSVFSCHSLAAMNFNGKWLDNGSGNTRIGNLVVTDNKLTIKHVVSYSIRKDRMAGSSQIYKVIKVNKKTDPLGCGPTSKVTYIIISTLPNIPGTNQIAIGVDFYGGLKSPNLKKLDDDPAVCASYSFGRDPNSH